MGWTKKKGGKKKKKKNIFLNPPPPPLLALHICPSGHPVKVRKLYFLGVESRSGHGDMYF